MCRQEYMVEIHRTQLGFKRSQLGSTNLDWDKPWNSILRMLAEDERFWTEQVQGHRVVFMGSDDEYSYTYGSGSDGDCSVDWGDGNSGNGQ